jgi:biopolymer transport protein ExbB/TolQ
MLPTSITTHGIGAVAWGVILTLMAMSILSIAVMGERFWTFRRSARQSRRFAAEVARLLRSGKLRDAVTRCTSQDLRHAHLARALRPGLDEWLATEGRREGEVGREAALAAVKEAIQQSAALELSEMKRGLPALATIGSTAPFVGLFGTTFGIMDAFAAIGVTGAGGFATGASGIAEALVTTALGLVVAVPAVWAYNYFAGRLERVSVEIDRASYELVGFLAKSQG